MHVFEMKLKRGGDGRIVKKTETMAGTPATWKYVYDGGGRLTEAHLNGRLICQCYYDKEGRRIRDYLPVTAGPGYRDYQYTMDNRLLSAGNNTYAHDDNGFRSIWSNSGTYCLYEYAPDYRLLKWMWKTETASSPSDTTKTANDPPNTSTVDLQRPTSGSTSSDSGPSTTGA
ncbi:hypothetical protein [Desulfovibrio sp. Fe33]|uniref:hypothetical protein n=1 Tax=Desulfovibrio sp. Fe33 TaxID=3020842 RepID=UPI00234D93DB|nr:hypothetical protein [Desulfovibrio sp. Fe33]